MAKYRPIYVRIWKDPDFEEYTPEGKLLFVYLCTNPSTTESGIYPISKSTIANETGIPLERVKILLDNGLKNVMYDPETRHIYVRRFHLYNPWGKPDLIRKSIGNDFIGSPQSILWQHFVTDYPEFTDTLTSLGLRLTNNIGIGIGIAIERLANGLPTIAKPLALDEGILASLAVRFPGINIESEWADCLIWWKESGKNMQRPQSALVNWLKNTAKKGRQDAGETKRYQGVPGHRPTGAFRGVEERAENMP
jgi:hypothetical protein